MCTEISVHFEYVLFCHQTVATTYKLSQLAPLHPFSSDVSPTILTDNYFIVLFSSVFPNITYMIKKFNNKNMGHFTIT